MGNIDFSKTLASIVPSLSTLLTDDTTTIKQRPINKGNVRLTKVWDDKIDGTGKTILKGH